MTDRATLKLTLFILAVVCSSAALSTLPKERLPREIFDVEEPSARVTGSPGNMSYLRKDCRSIYPTNLRERIVHTAVQEWAYFGFKIYDLTHTRDDNPNYKQQPWVRPAIDPVEAARVADSIAGYWSSTPNSGWILERQNQYWNVRGPGSRWRDPWSAAFISWIMCESGIIEPHRFQRAVAHHTYIDQAIITRDKQDSPGLFAAFDIGEERIEPGDLLCRGSRPEYESIKARRLQIGVGARSHCDIVVKLDEENKRIMVIGGNVRAWVRLKLLPADHTVDGVMIPAPYNGRRIFAHLKLQAGEVSSQVFDASPSLLELACDTSILDLSGIITMDSSSCLKQVAD